MPAAKTPKPAPSAYDPEVYYDVQLARVVTWRGRRLSPGKQTTLRGDVCEAVKEDILSAEPV